MRIPSEPRRCDARVLGEVLSRHQIIVNTIRTVSPRKTSNRLKKPNDIEEYITMAGPDILQQSGNNISYPRGVAGTTALWVENLSPNEWGSAAIHVGTERKPQRAI